MNSITSLSKIVALLSCLSFALAGCDGGGGGGGGNDGNQGGGQSTNTAPVAKAGPDRTAAVGAAAQLDGGGSSDADGDTLRYQWTLLQRPTGSNATLTGADAVKASFTLDKPGDYVAQLIVNDGQANSAPDSVTISTRNSKPVANAGQDQAAQVGDAVQLDGGKSKDADGNTLTYKWSLLQKPAGSSAALIGADSVKPGLIVDAPGSYEAQLIVNDGQVDSDPDTVIISTENVKPVANAGPDQSAAIGNTVQLDGSRSTDANGDRISYRWTLTQKPAGSNATLLGADSAKPGFVVDVPGDYVAQLIVNDGQVDSDPDTAIVSTENVKPVANAGANQTVALGATAQLDGAGSSDADGDPLTYRWTLSNKPGGSAAVLSDPAARNPTLVADKPGAYTVTLVVNDGQVDSDPAQVTITTQNVPPVANAGPDQSAVRVNAIVTLDGSNSTDLDGDLLRYQWRLIRQPAGSSTTLIGPDSVKPGLEVDMPGEYEIQLIVNDGRVDSSPDTVLVSTSNVKPVADAGAGQSVKVGDTVQLDGSRSTDANGDQISYRWTLTQKPAGSNATLLGADSAKPGFIVDAPGDYTAQLIVNDGQADSDPASVVISTTNVKPVANAGAAQTARVGTTVQLNGSGSTDADGDSLTYRWSLITKPAGSTAMLLGDSAINPGFAIDQPGDYVAQLIVNDGQVDSDPVTVTISTQNTAPVANAGIDRPLSRVNEPIELDGGGSYDVDGDRLSYRWTWLQRPTGSNATLLGADSVNPGFVIDVPGDYIAQLIVNDGQVDSAPDTVTITSQDIKPIADAGFDQTIVLAGSTVQLNGSNSNDPDNQPLTYRWSLIAKPGGSNATLENANTKTPTFVVDIAGDYVAQLIVNDGYLDSDPDTVLITRSNVRPIANAGPDQVVLAGATVQLDGSLSSDPNNDPLTYRWSLTPASGSNATLSDPTAQKPTFRVDQKGRYTAQLIVNDGQLDSNPPDTVTVQVPEPIALGSTSNVVSIGKNLQTPRQILLEIPAPAPNGTTVTLTSADPNKLKLSSSDREIGSGVLAITIPAGESFSSIFYFQNFVDTGSVNVTATAPGYPTGNITANLNRSGFTINAPSSSMPRNSSLSISVQARMLDSTGRPISNQRVGPDFTYSVTLENTNPAVGALSTNPVVISEGQSQVNTTFRSTNTADVTTIRIIRHDPANLAVPSIEQAIEIKVQ